MSSHRFLSVILLIVMVFAVGIIAGMLLIRVSLPAGYTLTPSDDAVDPAEAVVMNVYRELSPTVVNIVGRRLGLNFWMQVVPQSGQGSGFVIDEQGHILTTNHVVAKAEKLEVTVLGDQVMEGRLVGVDPVSDLAVVKVDPFPGMKVAPLGDSDTLAVGQRVIAIGNPFGLQHTVTSGFVSALNRDIMVGQRTIMGMIQTDAAINPGNSGAPLINSRGEVIGICEAIINQSIGIGMALTINRARSVARQIIGRGRVIYPWLGIKAWLDLSPRIASRVGLAPVSGVLISEIFPDSPASAAGLRGGDRYATYRGAPLTYRGRRLALGGDIIVAVAGVRTPSFDTYRNVILQKDVGDAVEVTFVRDEQELTVQATLAEDPRIAH